ncbi:serine hydrolase domain-containing protein [Gilvibacter sediminis]|uniref:serine hydrolase domain-containing protein n=1 Tax=Gilvibacter sediminis TaxID=379071 RepID=UPI002350A37C|nr:serine hydrolase domain-containing protein [Gilvibacter sediminis]MDC7998029.1 serine hydrolase [Gilvibacter sediminis]
MPRIFALKLIALCCVILCLISCSKDSGDIKTLLGTTLSQQTIDAFLDREMKALNIPGLSIAIINEGQVVYHRVKGMADKQKQLPVDSLSIFEGASISKPVFGHFVMTLVDDGLLDLDKPLYQYLPNPDIAHDPRYKKITARMALSHRTGFPNWRDDYPEKELFIQFEPGSEYHYSGEGYQYLAEVIRHLLKTNWAGVEAEFQKRVAHPLGMRHTKFIQDDYIRKHKVQPYDQSGQWIDKYANPWWASRDSVFVAPTTLHSEALDFSKWMIAMMNQQGLSQEGFTELYKPHSEISNGLLQQDYTLGFTKLAVLNRAELFTHSGNNDGFSTYFAFDKDKKWGFVFFANASRAGEALAQHLSYRLLLSGTVWKIGVIVLVFVFGLMLLLNNLFALLFKPRAVASRVRKVNLLIGLTVCVWVVVLLLLMLSPAYGWINYLYPLALFSVLLLVAFSLKQLRKQTDTQERKNSGMIFQQVLLTLTVFAGLLLIFVE